MTSKPYPIDSGLSVLIFLVLDLRGWSMPKLAVANLAAGAEADHARERDAACESQAKPWLFPGKNQRRDADRRCQIEQPGHLRGAMLVNTQPLLPGLLD